jgi:hypothetical protein
VYKTKSTFSVFIMRAQRSAVNSSLINLSVEEENLAAIPFAILERRVGKRVGKIELNGTKILPNGQELRVVWQVQGNSELGLPTEQDLDIFVALGVLTFQNNFSKTVSFTGREIAKILRINSVHGKFYKRLKLAMDRFIPLRYRAIAVTENQEQVKWLNVFQEASFSLDKTLGRCTGMVTWTDKLIQSMDNGFFRVLNAGRYMGLDGITAKHLYRFLAVAFERTDMILIDARKLATEHLGILNPPKYLSRLMQTLEPAFDQLIGIQVLGSYHVVSAEEWRVALHRNLSYVPERKMLLLNPAGGSREFSRDHCQKLLEKAGVPASQAAQYAESANKRDEFYTLERAGQLLLAMKEEEVIPHVALSVVRTALDKGVASAEARELLDWCEIALQVCRDKKRSGQKLRNAAGLIVKIIKDPETRERVVGPEMEASARRRFRQREQAVLRQEEEAEQRTLILEYEQYRERLAQQAFDEIPELTRDALRKEKLEILRGEERCKRLSPTMQEQEADALILREIIRKEAPPYEKWRLRKKAQQAVLPFGDPTEVSDVA